MKIGSTSLRDLARSRDCIRRRESSYDRTGGNADSYKIAPGEKRIIFDVKDVTGIITHIWTTHMVKPRRGSRGIILRMWWDDDPVDSPSVESPLSDFFGIAWGIRRNMTSLPIQNSVRGGKGNNCWWPMPFKKAVRIEVENLNPGTLALYFYIDWEEYVDGFGGEQLLYFHAHYRQEDFKARWVDRDTGKRFSGKEWQFAGGKNTLANGGYKENYVILETSGVGQYVGVTMGIKRGSCAKSLPFAWPGEGDDMIWIDSHGEGEPQLNGTGTEDYFNTAYCPSEFNCAPYHGVVLGGGFNWRKEISYYRFHVEDPIPFKRDVKVTIEHGHDNHYGGRWTSCAYWYQSEPHPKQPALPSFKDLVTQGVHG
ncbi:MAG: hypothetical protein RBG13Loki_2952 [Promethearchaeota archaeon CR_4]|nr:MAG: hypothetical protein RBG13Loki_2952 [Candidatus Lokiarchaeota archaeon CR_4]